MDLGISDVGVLANLGGDGGAKLGLGDDVVEVVDLHDIRDGSTGGPEEVEHAAPRLLQAHRVGRHLDAPQCERHLSSSVGRLETRMS